MDHVLVPMQVRHLLLLRRIMADVAIQNAYCGGVDIKARIDCLNAYTQEEVAEANRALAKLG